MPAVKPGRLFLVPAPLGENVLHTLPAQVAEEALKIRFWVVENVRTTRRLLKSLDRRADIDNMRFWEWDKHRQKVPGIEEFWAEARQGHDLGLMSEAGTPAVADPGNIVVKRAHELGFTVVPLVGPNAILLALMSSGFNGQQFAFHGYLPIDSQPRRERLRHLEAEMLKTGQTQLFIETPYRNNPLLAEIVEVLHPDTLLCLAVNLTTPQEYIRTQTVRAWKKQKPDLHKQPCIFAIGK